MEIIKILGGFFLFFFLTWIQLFYLILGILFYYFYKYNLFLENTYNNNNFFYSLIYITDCSFKIVDNLWIKIKKTKYINYIPLKLEQLNDKYLEYKRKLGWYFVFKLTNLFFNLSNKTEKKTEKKTETKTETKLEKKIENKTENTDKKIKLNTNKKITCFLDNLRNKAN